MLEIPTVIFIAIIVLAVFLVIFRSNVLVYISNEKIGIVEKKWATSGSLEHGFIALNG